MSTTPARTVLVATVALLTLASVGFASANVAGPGDPPEPTTENHPPSEGANFTVQPDDHSPGTQTAYNMLSRGEGPWGDSDGLRTIDFYKITTQATQFQDCTPDNARAFGIDRENDDPGTETDDPLLQHMKDYNVTDRVIIVDLYNESDAFGESTHLNRSDETVARLAGCVMTPQEPGWYQFTGYVNGTNYQGEFQEVQLYSKYFYVCDCENRQQAEQELGPPPYSGDGQQDGNQSDGQQDGDQTDTPTPTAQDDDQNDTTSPTDGTGTDATATDGTDQTSTSPGDEGTETGDDPADDPGGGDTPTEGNGPGLTAATAILAIVGGLLLLRRY